MTVSIPTSTIEDRLRVITECLVLGTRADGSTYRLISDLHANEEEVRDIVRSLHFGEAPNDWRYGIIYDLAHALLEHSEPLENSLDQSDMMALIPDVADGLVDDWETDLLEWAKVGGRLEFWDAPQSISEPSIAALLTARQYEEICFMGYTLLELLSD